MDKYFNNKWMLKEILLSHRDNTTWVYLTFEKKVKLRRPRTIMGIDINFNNVTYTIIDFNGKLVYMGAIPFNGLKRALSHKIIAERIQRKYSKKWKYVKGIREAIKKHGHRARNILVDSCHYVSKRIVGIAKEYNALIVLEDLNKLRNKANGSRRFNKKLSLRTYRRIQFFMHYKALMEGLNVVYVNPRGTSRTSPLGGKLTFIKYRWVKLSYGYIVTRDILASWNLALRGLIFLTRNEGSVVQWKPRKPPDQMQPQEGMKGKPVQVSIVPKISKI